MNVHKIARRLGLVAGALSLLNVVGCSGGHDSTAAATSVADTLAVSPTVSIDAVVNGGRQTVSLSFNSTDSSTLTNLKVTSGLSPLPAGWSGPLTFSCATVGTGSGCLLNLAYAPTAVGSGALKLDYGYTDSAGAAQTGTATVNYAGTTNNNVVGTGSPAGQIVATVGKGSQKATVAFTTDDGNSASDFMITTNLSTLPAGWSTSASSFTCGSASTGNGCELSLTYTPKAPASGILTLSYSYKDNSGDLKTGTVVLHYSATSDDNIVGTVAPTGPISGPIGNAAQAVAVTFSTDDGFPATDLSVTSGLDSLPLGWSASATSLTCASISTGAGCKLSLSFLPTATATGTLALGYAYTNNAGTAKTGTVNIDYRSTSHNAVLGTPNPGGTIRVKVGANKQLQLVFTTNDGNTATNFKVTSDLTKLPAGWSGANGFACAAVDSGTGCSLPLNYAPVTNATGALTLNFSYTDSAFTAQTGSATVQYSNPHLYSFDYSEGTAFCSINTDGTTAGCAATASGVAGAIGTAAFSANYAYLPSHTGNQVFVCTFDPAGTLSNCTDSGQTFTSANFVLISGGFLLVSGDSSVTSCAIGSLGALSNCTAAASISGAYALALSGSHLYVTTFGSGSWLCTIGADGSVSNCNATGGSAMQGAAGMRIAGGFSYAAVGQSAGTAGIAVCVVNGTDGTLSGCVNYPVTSATFAMDVAINGTDAYFLSYTTSGAGIFHCTLDVNSGAISACSVSNGGLSGLGGYSIGVQ
jgi:hypothetical protein